jgi:nucleoside-diphosphate kinase
MERTLIIIKPDAVQRGLIGDVIGRFERRGLKVVGMRFETVSRETAENHYGEHKGKPFFSDLVSYITSSPSVLMVLEGPDAIAVARTTIGATKPAEATPGTIRGDLGSDKAESARAEVDRFFGEDLVSYERAIDTWVLES